MSYRNCVLLGLASLICYACHVRAERNPYARYVAAGFSVIDRWALQDAPDQELFDGAMRGMVEVLRRHGDEHSQFVAAERREEFSEDISQEFGGVGIRLRLLGEPPLPTVIGPPAPGTPAFHADVRFGDRVVAVDQHPVESLSLNDVTQMIRGPAGESVTLTLQRSPADTRHDVQLTRAIIPVESVLGDVRRPDGTWQFRLTDHPDVAYVRITKFGDKTADELGTILADLTSEKPTALILDLRDNYGGPLDAAIEISDMFLRAGLPIVTTRGRDQKIRDRYLSTGTGTYLELPIAVLVNQNSASASEIVAACLQDYARAVVVGQRSYGKGTVQRLVRLESGRSILKITSATYWRPSGKNIHRMPEDPPDAQWGVVPNPPLEVKLDDEEYLQWRRFRYRRDMLGAMDDPQLTAQLDREDGALPPGFTDRAVQRAVEYLRESLPAKTPDKDA
jgi:carboxyl-terminal processing protease